MSNVFISHRGADTAEAERLAVDLRAQGHNVWLDIWDVGLGDSIVGKMNEGLAGSSYVILCLSSHGVDAQWIGREWMSSLARQLEGANVKLVPVVLTGGVPPAIIADIKYGDLTTDWNAGVQQLLAAIR